MLFLFPHYRVEGSSCARPSAPIYRASRNAHVHVCLSRENTHAVCLHTITHALALQKQDKFFFIVFKHKLTFQIAGILEVEKTYDICGKTPPTKKKLVW